MQDYGFKVVVGSRFGDIFRGNAGKSGLLVAVVDPTAVEALWSVVERDPATMVTVDLDEKVVRAGEVETSFEIDDYTRWRLLNGLDDIGITLTHEADIALYEGDRASFKPATL